ncbi:MAG: TraB/GumN family protein [Saprospiraceae bacterium]
MKDGLSLLWRLTLLSKDSITEIPPSYLLGTMHSASHEALYHVPLIKPYISACTHYFGETNLDSILNNAPLLFNSLEWTGLQSVLSKSTYSKSAFLLSNKYNIHLDGLTHLPPMMISAIISEALLGVHQSTIYTGALDQQLWNFAKLSNAYVDGIESAAEQEIIYKKIPIKFQVAQLIKLLTHISKSRKAIQAIATAYKKNDLLSIFHLSKKSLGPVRKILLHDRNNVMTGRIIQHLNNNESNFVSVGAAHLPGSKGILRLLKIKGIKLEAITL